MSANFNVDIDHTFHFLALLDEEADFFTFQTFDDDRSRSDRSLARIFHGPLDTHANALAALNASGAGIFVTVNATDGLGRKLANITRVRALWIEDDRGGIPPLPPGIEPQITVESSPGKHHVYFLASDADLAEFPPVQERLVRDYGSDPSAKDLARVLRLPGFFHMKDPMQPHQVRIVAESGAQPYPWETLKAAFPPVSRKANQTYNATIGKGTRPDARTEARIAAALADIDPDLTYGAWLRVGMALHAGYSGGKQGLDAWEAWSSNGTKWRAGVCDYHWKTFTVRPDGGVGLGTLWHLAGSNLHDSAVDNSVDNSDVTQGQQGFSASNADTSCGSTAEDGDPVPIPIWQRDLIFTKGKDGRDYIPSRAHNLFLILTHDKRFSGRWSWDEFADKPMIDGQEYGDHHRLDIERIMERDWIHGNVARQHLDAAIEAAQRANTFHPVKRYLQALVWDGVPRVAMFFSYYMGIQHDDYHRGAAIALFVSAYKRIYEPGCTVNTMTILMGDQNIGKTRTWRTLFAPWSAEVTAALDDKDFQQSLCGKWCMDFGELAAFHNADWNRVKQIMTMTEDHYRPPYGRTTITRPRACIFVGGTNADTFNRDSTGGVRWVPIRVPARIDLDKIAANRDQLWAEARHLAADAGQWWNIPNAEEHQEKIRIVDSWEGEIEIWADRQWIDGRNGGFTTTDVLRDALDLPVGKHGHFDQGRVGKILQKLGFSIERPREARTDGKPRKPGQRKYFKAPAWML